MGDIKILMKIFIRQGTHFLGNLNHKFHVFHQHIRLVLVLGKEQGCVFEKSKQEIGQEKRIGQGIHNFCKIHIVLYLGRQDQESIQVLVWRWGCRFEFIQFLGNIRIVEFNYIPFHGQFLALCVKTTEKKKRNKKNYLHFFF